MSLFKLSQNMRIEDDWKKNKTFYLRLVKEGIVLSLSYQGLEQDRRKSFAFYHPEGKIPKPKTQVLAPQSHRNHNKHSDI